MSLAGTLERTVQLVALDVFPSLEEDQILDGLTRTRVRVLADEQTAASHAGQTALASSVLAVAQTGANVSVSVPEAERVGVQPPLRGGPLPDALRELARNPGQDSTDAAGTVDLAVIFGAVQPPTAREVIHVTGDDWGCAIGADPGAGLVGALPFGGLLAGAAVGAEAFRLSLRHLQRRTGTRALKEHTLSRSTPIAIRLPALPREPLNLGAVDAISAGAITNAALFALLRWPGLRAQLRVFDDDLLEDSNLNRYALVLRAQLGAQKARLLASYATPLVSIQPICARFEDPHASRVALAERVLVGVDHIPSRWLVSRRAPGWVSIAGTTHFAAMVSEHRAGGPCGGCLHPYDDQQGGEIPTVSFVSQVAGYLQAHRLLSHGYGMEGSLPTLAAPFNLGGARAITTIGLVPREDCPVHCQASQAYSQRCAA